MPKSWETFQKRWNSINPTTDPTSIREMGNLLHWTYKPTRKAYRSKVHNYNNKILEQMCRARAFKDCSETTTTRFIFDDIITRFGCPNILMSDQGTHFINKTIEALTE
jgi:hypothetical protein